MLTFAFALGCKNTSQRPLLSCFEPHYESEAKYKVLIMKISFLIEVHSNSEWPTSL